MTALSPVVEPAEPAAMPSASARVLIVDDSAVARAIMARAIEASGRWQVARAVSSAAAAMAFLAVERVAAILLDVNLPGVDGLTALPDLLAAAPEAKVVVVSSAAAAMVKALALGAVDVLAKPGPGDYTRVFAARLVETLDRVGGLAVPTEAARPAAPPIVAAPAGAAADFDIVAIGASTGGIHALGRLLREVPPGCRAPILVTQHLPASFTPHFAAQLALFAGRPCDVAVDRLRVRPGRIIVAPGDGHIVAVALGNGDIAVRLSREPVASGCLPSVDPMLASLAAIRGERLLAVILSGMGRDGSEGARAVRAAGGCVLAQDGASSVVWGMPGAVVAAGLADAVMPPDAIGRVVAALKRP